MHEPSSRLTRSTNDRFIAGVCSGLARYLGIDPILVRLAFLLLIPASGLGLLIYIILWLLMPEEGAADNSPTGVLQDNLSQMGETLSGSARRLNSSSQGPTLIAVLLILLGLFFLLQNMGGGGAILGVLLLVGLVIYIVLNRRR